MGYIGNCILTQEIPNETSLVLYFEDGMGEDIYSTDLNFLVKENLNEITCICFNGGIDIELAGLVLYINSIYPDKHIAWVSSNNDFPKGEILKCLDYIKVNTNSAKSKLLAKSRVLKKVDICSQIFYEIAD